MTGRKRWDWFPKRKKQTGMILAPLLIMSRLTSQPDKDISESQNS